MRTNDEIIAYLNKLKDDQSLTISEITRRVGMAKFTMPRYFNKKHEFPINNVDKFAKPFGASSADILGMKKKATTADLTDNNVIFTYQGKPLSDEDKAIIRRLMNGQ